MSISVNVRCMGKIHKVVLADNGQLHLCGHPTSERQTEKIMQDLGGSVPRCLEILNVWRYEGTGTQDNDKLKILPDLLRRVYGLLRTNVTAQRAVRKLCKIRKHAFLSDRIFNLPSGTTYETASELISNKVSEVLKDRGIPNEITTSGIKTGSKSAVLLLSSNSLLRSSSSTNPYIGCSFNLSFVKSQPELLATMLEVANVAVKFGNYRKKLISEAYVLRSVRESKLSKLTTRLLERYRSSIDIKTFLDYVDIKPPIISVPTQATTINITTKVSSRSLTKAAHLTSGIIRLMNKLEHIKESIS